VLIGIITKPDALSPGSSGLRQRWARIMLNEEPTGYHSLKHGYYCVRLADDDQRNAGIGREEMKMVEERFFRETEPWSLHSRDGGEAEEKLLKRCGTEKLVEFLSRLLIELIEARYAYFPGHEDVVTLETNL
jgi:vacuolar protein sorting-associated protein 1